MAVPRIDAHLSLPGYAEMLLARHRAHAETFRDIVAAMPLESGQSVLDVACGDGCWCRWLAERIGPGGRIVGVDVSPDYLELARRLGDETNGRRNRAATLFRGGDARDLPDADASYDVTTCCHSFYEIDDPHLALHELIRVLRPGGHVCLVTADAFHHALLPWPSRLQATVQAAQERAMAKAADRRPFLSRHMADVLADLGLRNVTRRAFTTTRQGPLDRDERCYLQTWLNAVERRARKELPSPQRQALKLWIADCMERADDPSFAVTYTDMLTFAERP
jgi:ubiquinone/menaquinone biosynthesis C-methylase UbiE